eukprot:gene5721-19007_t
MTKGAGAAGAVAQVGSSQRSRGLLAPKQEKCGSPWEPTCSCPGGRPGRPFQASSENRPRLSSGIRPRGYKAHVAPGGPPKDQQAQDLVSCRQGLSSCGPGLIDPPTSAFSSKGKQVQAKARFPTRYSRALPFFGQGAGEAGHRGGVRGTRGGQGGATGRPGELERERGGNRFGTGGCHRGDRGEAGMRMGGGSAQGHPAPKGKDTSRMDCRKVMHSSGTA